MSFDAAAYRAASLQNWEEAAPGWARRRELLSEIMAPLARWLVDALALHGGERVLELAAGTGETAMLAAQRVGPAGSVIVSDQAQAMLEVPRARAKELGLENVEFRVLDAEWIDLPVAGVDAALCRMGYMLMADPAAALVETRRVLRPGGRLALAVWDEPQANPWAALPARVLAERGLAGSGAPGQPGMFALSDADALTQLLAQAGFTEVSLERVELARRHKSFEEFFDSSLELSRSFHDAVLSRPQGEIEQLRRALAERLRPYAAADGSLVLPGRALAASACA